jgi:hypothetical protein
VSSRWMLLSYNKPVEVSSELSDHPKLDAADENIRTYWSAKTGDKGEWIAMDLQNECTINAVQVNYAENETQIFGRNPEIYYQYMLEYSSDHKTWLTLVDKTANKSDVPHDYIELQAPIKARFIRLTNYRVPSGTFALADLRVFGKREGGHPSTIRKLNIIRSATDRCVANLKWDKSPDAVGFNIRYGTQKEKLYHNYQVLGTDTITIRSLNSLSKYYFTIDTFNENGLSKGNTVIEVE